MGLGSDRTSRRRRGVGLVLLLLMLLCITPNTAAASDAPAQNVLVLHSYHKGFEWTDDQNDGLVDRLETAKTVPVIYTEYLDWKRYPSKENLGRFYELVKGKYADVHIDVIVTTDDAALDFALKYQHELFNDAPIIFSGVNEVSYSKLPAHSKLTGVIENLPTAETVKMALYINPAIRNIYLIFDNSESGLTTGEMVESQIKALNPDLHIYPMNWLSGEEMKKRAASLGSDSILLMTTYYGDATGRVIEFDRMSSELAAASAVPVYHTYDFGLNHGAFGGSLLSGKLQGEKAGNLALRVLGGEDPESIPVSYAGTSRDVFDYNELTRFHVSLKSLPPGSEVVNRPFSFYETYRTLVLTLIAVFAALLVFILLLLIHAGIIRRIRNQLTASNERFSLAAYGADSVIWDFDMATMTYYFSDRWYELLGYQPGEIEEAHRGWTPILHPEDLEEDEQHRKDHLEGRSAYYYCESRFRSKSGVYLWFQTRGRVLRNEAGEFVRFAGSMTDITDRKGFESKLQVSYQELEMTYEELTALQQELMEQYNKVVENQQLLQASEEKYRILAYNDELSGLPNRLSLAEELKDFIEESPDAGAALFFMDIDNFKYINDSMGHTFGDRLLMQAGERLKKLDLGTTRHYRFGGDEFVIFLKNTASPEQTVFYAEALVQSFKEPFQLEDSTIHVSASVGVAQYPKDGTTAEMLLKNADIAMYKAKQAGKGTYILYGKSMQQHFDERVVIEKHLRHAIDNGEMSLHYQPQVNGQTGEVWGFEALIRWNSPQLGFVSPLSFIRIAEDCRLIVPIGEWVLRSACSFIADLNRKGFGPCHISINISVIQLLTNDFTDMVLSVVKETGLNPHDLELEITESVVMESFEEISAKLEFLKGQGIGVALDDFGTGYSSLSYLRQLPITTLKIDKSFIDGVPGSGDSMPLAGSIVAIGHDMGLKVTAEGVETADQLDFLEEVSCDKIQGYLISRPIPQGEVEDWMRRYEPRTADMRKV